MQISRNQMKNFNRINEKLKTNSSFFITNHSYLVKKYSYLKKSHSIVKCQLKFKKRRVVLSFNQLIKLGLNRKEDKDGKRPYTTKFQKKCHVRTKSETVHRKSILQKAKPKTEVCVTESGDVGPSVRCTTPPKPIVSESAADRTDVPATTEDVTQQIREQLKLLQSGRRSSISLLTNNGSTSRPSSAIGTKVSSCSSTPSYSRHPSHSSLDSEPMKSTINSDTPTRPSQNIFNQKPKFIDSLISKLKTQGLNLPQTSSADDSHLLSSHTSPEKSTPVLPRKSFNECESSMDIANDDDHLSDHSTSSKNGFLGFQEAEAQFERPNIPGMLPTPLVKKSKGMKSAFISEELDNFMMENALDNSAYRTAPLKKRHDEAMMYAEAQPPSLLCPQLPSDVEKPRTVAEKRQLLERKADIKYLMIENESTVYRELRKRAKNGPVPNYTLIRDIQEMNIPFTRDCWRATCWLNTPNGRFYYQTIRDSGKEIKVLGGKGNNSVKELVKLKPIEKKKFTHQECGKSCRLIGNIKINGLDELITESANHLSESTPTSKKLNTLPNDYSFQKPGPLSLKKLNPIKSSIDVELGPLELYSLPHIKLEVWPRIDRPLPDAVHPYLKLALPYEKITTEWAEFALSTLKQANPPANRRKRKRTTDTVDKNHRSFTFNIPYTNNQNRILVRKRRKIVAPTLTKLNSINVNEKTELSFMKDVDKTDDVAVAVADVLTGMINSVALTLCEANVVKDDPDIDYGKVDGQVNIGDSKTVGINTVDGKKKNTPAGKVVKELMKLNAKIIHGFDTVKREECTNEFCKLGCICDSLRGAQTYSYHCKEVNCMFQCKCPSSKINTSTFESAVHNSNIKQYCDRMNASLAKEEKDFTATVVVSDGKTIYVPTWDEKKKRLKKVPKRLSDCVQFESDFVHRDLSEMYVNQEKRHRVSKMEDVIDVDDRALMANKNDIVKNMIHVNVNVERLNVLDDLQPWCMVHCLYKCFCRFRAIDGRRFEFGNTKIDEIEQPTYTKKRQYTFERSKDEPEIKVSKFVPAEENDFSTCRRVRVVATNKYKIVNRARSEDIRRRVKKMEQDHPGLKVLLRNRVKRSIALAEVGPMVTVNDSYKERSRTSNERQSMSETNRSNHSMGSDAVNRSVEKETSSSTTNDSFKLDANANKYRSRFNNIIMKTMHGISQKLRTMTALPTPTNKAFYYMQWKHFLSAFNSDRIYIWEVQLNTKEVLLVVTDKNIMPTITNAMYVINIKAVSTERLPLLPKLIKLGVDNEETKNLSILLFGISNYWRVLGCTHSENDFMSNRVVAIPTPETNPRLASKIASLFNDMVKLTAINRSSTPSVTSNICIRQLDDADIDNISIPIPVVGSNRWLMLSLANDFSHIYVPAWKQFISYNKIVSALEHAKKAQQTVRWGPTHLRPQVYVPHNADMKLFFGPMQKNESLNLQLLQQCDGKMVLREDYQRLTKQKPNVPTTGTWLYMKDDHMMVNRSVNLRTYPPKLKHFNTKSSTSTQSFIPLKPSTITGNNMKIKLLSPTSMEDFTNCSTSTPTASSSGNVPSSELIRHLSLGLRARPAKVANKLNLESSPIKVVDTKLLMSPQFIPLSHDSLDSETRTPTSSYSMKLDRHVDSLIQKRPITLSVEPSMESNTDWKDVSKSVPIRKRRFTTIVSTDKPMLKIMLEKPSFGEKSSLTDSPATSYEDQNDSTLKQNTNRIRERRYTTIVSNADAKMAIKPMIKVKNFELVKNPGKKMTLAPIPNAETELMLNRPVVIKKLEPVNSIAESHNRQLTPYVKPSIVRPVASSTAPIVVVKPSSFNLNLPAKVSGASIASDRKSFVMKKVNNVLPTLRLMPSNIKILGKDKIMRHISDCVDDKSSILSKKLQTPVHSLSAGTNNTVNGYLVCQVRGLGKIMAKKLFAAYSVNLLSGSKLFHTFKHCTDYLNDIYVKEHIFAMVPAHLTIEWRFVSNDEDHSNYSHHNEHTLRKSMVLTKDELIDLNSDFDSNERYSMDLRHHLLVLRLAHACMKNFEARNRTGLEIVRKSETVVKELKTESKRLASSLNALRIEKHLNILKLNELKKKIGMGKASGEPSSTTTAMMMEKTDDVITIDSEDD